MRLSCPPKIKEEIEQDAAIAISISGGKDSQAILVSVTEWVRAQGYNNYLFAIHADLGRMEWKETPQHVERICHNQSIPLVIVRREKGDLLQHMQERMEQLKGQNKPHFPSSFARYCTSDHKRSPIDKELRKYDRIISVEGIRAAESRARAKKPDHELRKQLCTQTRTAYTWRPIFHWSDEDVWQAIGTSTRELEQRRLLYAVGKERQALDGWPAHPAYVMGNHRLSCALCVLADRNDLENGAKHNPELYQEIVAMEKESGFDFKHGFALRSI